MRDFILTCSDAYVSLEQSSLITKCSEALIIGKVSSLRLIVSDSLIIVGHGKLNAVLTDRLIAVSKDAPLILNDVYCKTCFIFGSKYPVLINRLRCLNTHLRKCLVEELATNKAFIGEEVIVKNLSVEQELILNDPYAWFKDLNVKQNTKLIFNYNVFKSENND